MKSCSNPITSGAPQRRPDVAFVSNALAGHIIVTPQDGRLGRRPYLAIEVNSPTNTTGTKIIAKIAEYFRAGVQHVWLVYPNASRRSASTSHRTRSRSSRSETPSTPPRSCPASIPLAWFP